MRLAEQAGLLTIREVDARVTPADLITWQAEFLLRKEEADRARSEAEAHTKR